MSKTITLRLNEDVYSKFRTYAENDNRSISNFIETSTLRYIEEHEFVDEFEMAEIEGNEELQKQLKRAHKDAKARKGRFV
jgi:predicted transcriptional regulator